MLKKSKLYLNSLHPCLYLTIFTFSLFPPLFKTKISNSLLILDSDHGDGERYEENG